jgi:dihydrofolate reductase
VESAVRKAQEIAGEKNVAIASANVLQQVVRLGLLEELHIDLVPVLLGDGTRLFDHIGGPVDLEITEVVQAPDVTHLTYRVKK